MDNGNVLALHTYFPDDSLRNPGLLLYIHKVQNHIFYLD